MAELPLANAPPVSAAFRLNPRARKEHLACNLQQRFHAGADCGWMKLDGLEGLYCRRNGRTFRVVQGKDKRWSLYRVLAPDDGGALLGTYQGRRDANNALEKIAYGPEPQW